jgi:hypothetical protein
MFVILRTMRSPCARNATVLLPYQFEPTENHGLLLGFPANEPVICPGDGQVFDATYNGGGAVWIQHSVRLPDHVEVLQTIMTGFDSIDVQTGDAVVRGQRLGMPRGQQLLFQVIYSRDLYDPSTIGPHFVAQDGFLVVGEDNTLEPAPDILPDVGRYYDTSIVSNVVGGVRYFSQ